jgi:NTE family protein
MRTISNLVFQGGSVKALAYLGALEILEQQLEMQKIKRTAGASAGSMIAALFAIGYDAKKLTEALAEFDKLSFLDDKTGGIPTESKVMQSLEKSNEGKSVFFSKIPSKIVKGVIGHRLIEQFGIYEGDSIRQWLERHIQARVNKVTEGKLSGKHLNFAALHELAEKYPRDFRDLYVVGVNLNTGKKTCFSYESTPRCDCCRCNAHFNVNALYL